MQVLSHIPTQWSIKSISPFINKALVSNGRKLATLQLECSLLKCRLLSSIRDQSKLNWTNHSIVLNDNTKCSVCYEPINCSEGFSWALNSTNQITHVRCGNHVSTTNTTTSSDVKLVQKNT